MPGTGIFRHLYQNFFRKQNMDKAVLITIGDEILSGNTVDTNSNFIASELKNIGIKVVQIFTISDEIETIKNTLNTAFELGDLVITTGGLGPTRDDKTKKHWQNSSMMKLPWMRLPSIISKDIWKEEGVQIFWKEIKNRLSFLQNPLFSRIITEQHPA